MRRPQGYDELEMTFERKIKLPPGGYVCKIRSVEECISKRGSEQIKVEVDIAEGDFFHYWMNKWQDRIKEKGKVGYPKGGTVYILTYQNGLPTNGVNKTFKGFCEAFKLSNDCEINWTTGDFGKQFQDKFIGVVYRNVEDKFNGHKFMQPTISYFTTVDKIRANDFSIPKDKLLEDKSSGGDSYDSFPDSFATAEEDIPF